MHWSCQALRKDSPSSSWKPWPCNAPVISTFVAGIPELVEPNEHGWLVSAGDVDGLAAAMRACLECPGEQIQAMGAKARTKVVRFHDVDHEAAVLAGLFQSAYSS
ncbi:glycosyltransferase [Bradyrhizobium sp. USDA 4470]